VVSRSKDRRRRYDSDSDSDGHDYDGDKERKYRLQRLKTKPPKRVAKPSLELKTDSSGMYSPGRLLLL
jgi:hypothetical protein